MAGKGRVYLRGRRWWINFHHRGIEYRESAGRTREEAKTFLKNRRREIEERAEGEGDPDINRILEHYEHDLERRGKRSLRTVRSHLKPLRDLLGARRARDLSVFDIEEYQQKRLKAKKKPATIDRETEILRASFRLAKGDRLLETIPRFPLFRPDNTRTGFFEPEEFEELAKHLPPTIADAARFGFHTGWRKGEIVGLTWDRVDREAGEVRLFTSKNGKPRTVPLSEELVAIIERRWKEREFLRGNITALSQFVFHKAGRALGDFRRTWAEACSKAKLSGRVFHDLRRSAVRNMVRAGVPQSIAMGVSGHRTPSIFGRYDIASTRDKLKALRDAAEYVRQRSQSHSVSDFPTSSRENPDKKADKN